MKQGIVIGIVFFLAACAHFSPTPDDALFEALDDNKDGTVTMEELGKEDLVIETKADGHKEVHQPEADDEAASTTPMTFEQKRRLLEDMDQNKDGSINRQEWNRASDEGFMLWKF